MCYTDRGPTSAPTDHGWLDRRRRPGADRRRRQSLHAYAARAATPTEPASFVIPDPRGVQPLLQDLVRRLAQPAWTPSPSMYLARTAGMSDDRMTSTIAPKIGQTKPERSRGRGRRLRLSAPKAGGAVESCSPVGFCFGGASIGGSPPRSRELTGAIGFYGIPSESAMSSRKWRAPLLLLLAGNRPTTTQEDFGAVRPRAHPSWRSSSDGGYEGAPHSFFRPQASSQHKDASAEMPGARCWPYIKEHTRPTRAHIDVGPAGVWLGSMAFLRAPDLRRAVAEIEEMRFGAIGSANSSPPSLCGPVRHPSRPVRSVANRHRAIGARERDRHDDGARALAEAWPNRFRCKIGVSHAAALCQRGTSV